MKETLSNLNETIQKSESRLEEIEKLFPQLTTQSSNVSTTIVTTTSVSNSSLTNTIATTPSASNTTTSVTSSTASPTTTQN